MLLRSIAPRIATISRTKLLTATQHSINFAPCQYRPIHSTVSRTMSASGESESKGAGKSGITSWADSKDGSFKRQTSSFRDAIEDGGKFAPEKGRYHLYVSLACPWAHRALIVRKLKGLEEYMDVSTVHPHMLEGGWHFAKSDKSPEPASAHSDDTFPNATVDKLHSSKYMSDLYYKAQPDYSARFTVPVVWDTKHNTIVNNESSEVIRFFNTAFNSVLTDDKAKQLDLYPEELRAEIDELNEWVYNDVNNGVYKSGFATKQEAYEKAVTALSDALDRLEKLLSDGREFLVGGRLTEADVRLYTTIIRYDPVYHGHFKCNSGLIRHSYPNLNKWLKRLYWQNPAFKDTTDFEHIKEHYYYSHAQINPTRIVPLGPNPNIENLKDDEKTKQAY